MGKVIEGRFRREAKAVAALVAAPDLLDVADSGVSASRHRRLVAFGKAALALLLRVVHTLLVLVWPFLKWGLGVEVGLRFMVMLYRWNDAGSPDAWVFLGHFSVLVLLTWIVSAYKGAKA